MRVFIITQDEPVYAPVYLTKILNEIRYPVVGVTALSPAGRSSWTKLARQRLDMYGPVDFTKAAMLYSYSRARDLLPNDGSRGRFYSVAKLAEHYAIPLLYCSDVNAPAYVDKLSDLGVDILISVAANQRFGSALLNMPQMACLNVHSALLPKYRGMDGLFWALVYGETQVGVTVHLMNAAFDEGAIVAQRPFEVGPEDTLHRLYYKAIDVGAELIAQSLDAFNLGSVNTVPNNVEEDSYFSWPNHEAARQFRENGRRFF